MQNLCNSEGKVIGLISLLTIILSFDTEKNDRMMSVHFQDKPFKITVIQVCDPDSNAEEAEVEQFYEDLQDLLELTHTHTKKKKKDVFFIIGDWNAEVGMQKSRATWSKRHVWPWSTK